MSDNSWVLVHFVDCDPGKEFDIFPRSRVFTVPETPLRPRLKAKVRFGKARMEAYVVQTSEDYEYLKENFKQLTATYTEHMLRANILPAYRRPRGEKRKCPFDGGGDDTDGDAEDESDTTDEVSINENPSGGNSTVAEKRIPKKILVTAETQPAQNNEYNLLRENYEKLQVKFNKLYRLCEGLCTKLQNVSSKTDRVYEQVFNRTSESSVEDNLELRQPMLEVPQVVKQEPLDLVLQALQNQRNEGAIRNRIAEIVENQRPTRRQQQVVENQENIQPRRGVRLVQVQPAERPANVRQRRSMMNHINVTEQNGMTFFGSNRTAIPKYIFDDINWYSHSAATRRLLVAVFTKEVLASHTLTGKPSPAFLNAGKAMKTQLDPSKTADIIEIVAYKCNVSASIVRSAITTKCADENKMHKKRVKQKLERQLEMEAASHGAL